MKCPKCGLINPDTALRCDCGYNFESGKVEGGPAPPTARQVTSMGTTVSHDPGEIEDCARRLYARANAIISYWTVTGTLFGAVSGGALGYYISPDAGSLAGPAFFALMGAAIGGLGGREEGKNRAVSLRLQAQNALCLMQIEENTRDG